MSRTQLDITDTEKLRAVLDEQRPTAVINAAAQANVNRAEQHLQQAMTINGHAVESMASLCAERGIRLVHISTDYVLDYPEKNELTEDLPTNPRSSYAHSKVYGERAALRAGAVVVRVQWVYQPGDKGFFNVALNALAAGKPLSLVTDQVGRPTPAERVAEGLLLAAEGGPVGLFHLACQGQATAVEWIAAAAQHRGLSMATARHVTRAQLGGAHRPRRSCLCTDRFASAWGWRPECWDVALADAMR